MAAPAAGIAIAIRAGLLKVLRDPKTAVNLTTQAKNVTKLVSQRQAAGKAARPAVENYLMSQSVQLGTKVAAWSVKQTGLPKYAATKAQPLRTAASEASFSFKRWATLPRGNVAAGRPIEQLRRFRYRRDPLARFTNTAVNRGIIDYAQFQAIHLAIDATNKVLKNNAESSNFNPVASDDGTVIAGQQVTEEGSLGERFQKIAVAALVGGRVSPMLKKYRRGTVSLATVNKSSATRYGERLSQNTIAARHYYGSRVPEVAGNLVGGVGAMVMLGSDPRDIATALGTRGAVNAGVGFYNLGKPTQMKLPKMGPSWRNKTGQARVKGFNRTIKKVKKVSKVAETHYKQEKLF